MERKYTLNIVFGCTEIIYWRYNINLCNKILTTEFYNANTVLKTALDSVNTEEPLEVKKERMLPHWRNFLGKLCFQMVAQTNLLCLFLPFDKYLHF